MITVAELTVRAGAARPMALLAGSHAWNRGRARRVAGLLDPLVAERAAVTAADLLIGRLRRRATRDECDEPLPQPGLGQRCQEVLLVRERGADEHGARGPGGRE